MSYRHQQEQQQQQNTKSKETNNSNNNNDGFLSEFQHFLNDEDSLISDNDFSYQSTQPQHLTTTTNTSNSEDCNTTTTTITSTKNQNSEKDEENSMNTTGLNSTSYITNPEIMNQFLRQEKGISNDNTEENTSKEILMNSTNNNCLEYDDDDDWGSFDDIVLNSKKCQGPLVQGDVDLVDIMNLSNIGILEEENDDDSCIVNEISSSFKSERDHQSSHSICSSNMVNDDIGNRDFYNTYQKFYDDDNDIVAHGKDINPSSYSSDNLNDSTIIMAHAKHENVTNDIVNSIASSASNSSNKVEKHQLVLHEPVSEYQSQIYENDHDVDENGHDIDENIINATSTQKEKSSISPDKFPTLRSKSKTLIDSIKSESNFSNNIFNDLEHITTCEQKGMVSNSLDCGAQDHSDLHINNAASHDPLDRSITSNSLPHKSNNENKPISTPSQPTSLTEAISTVKIVRKLVNKVISPYSVRAHLWLNRIKHPTSDDNTTSTSTDNISKLLSLENCPKVSAIVRVKRVSEAASSKIRLRRQKQLGGNDLLGLKQEETYTSSDITNTTTAAHCLFPIVDEDLDNVSSSTRKEIILVNPDAFGKFVSTEVTVATARAVAELKNIASEDWVKCYRVDDVLWPDDNYLDSTAFIPLAQAMVNDSFVKRVRNSVCFCTGGNVSGKKYAMLGPQWYSISSDDSRRQSSSTSASEMELNFGILGFIVKYTLENHLSDTNDGSLCVSVLEIIHEDHIVDLLQNCNSTEEEQPSFTSPTTTQKQSKQNGNLRVREHPDGQGAFVPNLKQMIVKDIQDLNELYSFASKIYHENIKDGRYIGGHILVSIKKQISCNGKINNSSSKEKVIQLVLLASASDLENDKEEALFTPHKDGNSKRIAFRTPSSRSGISTKGDSQHLEQRAFIRKSIAAIGAMLRNILLHHKKNHNTSLSLSFRESVLTRLLKRSLHPVESRAVVVSCCCPSRLAYSSTLTTLNFVHRLIRSASKSNKALSPFAIQPSNRRRESHLSKITDAIEDTSVSSGTSISSSIRRTTNLHSQEVLNKIMSAQKNEETRKEIKKALLKTMLCDPRQRLSWGEDDNTLTSTSTTNYTLEKEEQEVLWSGGEHDFLTKLKPISTDNEDDVSLLSSSPDKHNPATIKEHDILILSDLQDGIFQKDDDSLHPLHSLQDNLSPLDNHESLILSNLKDIPQIDSKGTLIDDDDELSTIGDVSNMETKEDEVLVDDEILQAEYQIKDISNPNHPSSPFYEDQQQFTPSNKDADYSTHSTKEVDDSVSKEELHNMLSHLYTKVQRLESDRDSLLDNIQSFENHCQLHHVDKLLFENEKKKIQQAESEKESIESNCRVKHVDKATSEQEKKQLKDNIILLQNQLQSQNIEKATDEMKRRTLVTEVQKLISEKEFLLLDIESLQNVCLLEHTDKAIVEQEKQRYVDILARERQLKADKATLLQKIQSLRNCRQCQDFGKILADEREQHEHNISMLKGNCQSSHIDKTIFEQKNARHKNAMLLLQEENEFIETSHKAIFNELKETIAEYENQLDDAKQESKEFENKVEHLTIDLSRLKLQLFGLRLALKFQNNTEDDDYSMEDKSIQADYSMKQERYNLINKNEHFLSFIAALSNRLHHKLNHILETNKCNNSTEYLAESCNSLLTEMAYSLLVTDDINNEGWMGSEEDAEVTDYEQDDTLPSSVQNSIHDLGIKMQDRLAAMQIIDERVVSMMHNFSHFITSNNTSESKNEERLLNYVYYQSLFSLTKEDRKLHSLEFGQYFTIYTNITNSTNHFGKNIYLQNKQQHHNHKNFLDILQDRTSEHEQIIRERDEQINRVNEELLSSRRTEQELKWTIQTCGAKLSAEQDLRKDQEIDFMGQISAFENKKKELRAQQTFEFKSTNDHLLQRVASLEIELESHQESISYLQNSLQVEKKLTAELIVEQELRKQQENEVSKLIHSNTKNEKELNSKDLRINSLELDVISFKETVSSLQKDLQVSESAKMKLKLTETRSKIEMKKASQKIVEVQQDANKSSTLKEKKIKTWEENAAYLRKEVEQLREELVAAKSSFIDSKTLNDKLRIQNESYRSDIDSLHSLESEVQVTRSNEKRLQNELHKSFDQNELQQREQISILNKVREELEDKTNVLFCLEQQLQKYREINKTLVTEKDRGKIEIASLQSQLNITVNDGNKKIARMSSQDENIVSLQLERDHARYNEKQFQKELESIKVELELTKSTADAELNRAKKELSVHNDAQVEHIANLQNKVSQLQDKLSIEKTSSNKFEALNDRLVCEKDRIMDELGKLQSAAVNDQTQIDLLKTKIQLLEHQLEKCQELNEKLRIQKDQIQYEVDSLRSNLAMALDDGTQKDLVMTSQNDRIEALKFEIEQMQKNELQCQEDMLSLKISREELSNKITAMRDLKNELNRTKMDLNSMRDLKNELNRTKMDLNSATKSFIKLSEVDIENECLNKSLKAKISAEDKLQEQLAIHEAEINGLQCRLVIAIEDGFQKDALLLEANKISVKLKKREEMISSLKKSISTQNGTIASIQLEIDQARKNVLNLKKEEVVKAASIISIQQNADRIIMKLKEELESMNTVLISKNKEIEQSNTSLSHTTLENILKEKTIKENQLVLDDTRKEKKKLELKLQEQLHEKQEIKQQHHARMSEFEEEILIKNKTISAQLTKMQQLSKRYDDDRTRLKREINGFKKEIYDASALICTFEEEKKYYLCSISDKDETIKKLQSNLGSSNEQNGVKPQRSTNAKKGNASLNDTSIISLVQPNIIDEEDHRKSLRQANIQETMFHDLKAENFHLRSALAGISSINYSQDLSEHIKNKRVPKSDVLTASIMEEENAEKRNALMITLSSKDSEIVLLQEKLNVSDLQRKQAESVAATIAVKAKKQMDKHNIGIRQWEEVRTRLDFDNYRLRLKVEKYQVEKREMQQVKIHRDSLQKQLFKIKSSILPPLIEIDTQFANRPTFNDDRQSMNVNENDREDVI